MDEVIQAETQLYSFSINGLRYTVAATTHAPRAIAHIVAFMKDRELSGEFSDATRLMELDKKAHLLSIPNELTEKFTDEMKHYNCAFSVIEDRSENYDYILVADKDMERASTIIETITNDYEHAIINRDESVNLSTGKEGNPENPNSVRNLNDQESISGTPLRTSKEADENGRKPIEVLMAEARSRMSEVPEPGLDKGAVEI